VGRDAEVLEARIYDPLGILARGERDRVLEPLIRQEDSESATSLEKIHQRHAKKAEAEIVRRESMFRGVETEYVLPYVDLTANAFMRSAAEYGPKVSEDHALSWAVLESPILRKAQFVVLLRGGEVDGEKEDIWPKYLHGVFALGDLDGDEM
jgi:hypothetical protein